MEFKKSMIILIAAIFLVSIAGVCASDANDTAVVSEDANQIELAQGEDMAATDEIQSTVQTNGTEILAAGDEETTDAQNDMDTVGLDQKTYADLSDAVGSGGDKDLQAAYYKYKGESNAIVITTPGIINGNGAVIDMAGSTIYAFDVKVAGVTFKNLTIKNANCVGYEFGGAIYFDKPGAVENCNFENNVAKKGGAVYFRYSSTVVNCNFTNNAAMKSGGAIYFNSLGNVTNCNFVNNKINNDDGIKGGAICIVGNTYDYSTVSNCNFSGNEAISGGAMSIDGPSIVINCSFINNKAVKDYSRGGAIYFGDSGSVINCNFVNNYAKYDAGAIYSQYPGTTADTCIFKSESDSTNSNVVILPPTLNVDDFATVYGSCENLTFDLKTNSGMSLGDVDISVSVYYKNNDSWFGNYSRLSGEGWTVDFPVGFYYAVFSIDYKNFEKINRTITVIPNISYYVNVTSLTTNSRTVNITAKSNIPQEGIQGELLFILPNNANITANYNADGTWWVVHTFDVCGVYEIRASYSGLSNVTINNATITINKLKTQLKASAVTTTYNVNKNLVITLKDSNGIALRDVKVSVNMGSAKTHKTDKNGQIKIAVGSQVPKTYSVKIKFDGNANYIASSSTVKVTVKKATPKLAAKAKTFKKAVKTKKYSVTLKNNKNKVMKNTKVTLKIKGKKAITVKTNNKGVATFIVKLTKKGTLKSTVTYKGNKYYNKVTKTVNIKIK